MADQVDEDRLALEQAAAARMVRDELDERLAAVWGDPADDMARERLRSYLDSPRLMRGINAGRRMLESGV